jgi:hypothetical protein
MAHRVQEVVVAMEGEEEGIGGKGMAALVLE